MEKKSNPIDCMFNNQLPVRFLQYKIWQLSTITSLTIIEFEYAPKT